MEDDFDSLDYFNRSNVESVNNDNSNVQNPIFSLVMRMVISQVLDTDENQNCSSISNRNLEVQSNSIIIGFKI